MKHFPRVLRYLRPYGRLAVVSVVVTLVGALAVLLMPWPLKILIDNVLGGHPLPAALRWVTHLTGGDRRTLLMVTVIAMLLLKLLVNAIQVLGNYVHTKLHQHIVLDVRSDLFQQAQRLSLAFHDHRRSGKLVYAINSQADTPAELLLNVPPLAESVLTLVGMCWIAYRIDPKLTLLSLTVLPFLYFAVGRYVRQIRGRLRDVKDLESESLSIVQEAISMLRVIVAFGREDYEHRRFRDQGQQAVDARIKITVRQTLFSLTVNMITAAGGALVLWIGASHALQGQLTVGDLLVVLAYLMAIYRPLEAISNTVASWQDRFVNLQMLFELLDADPEIKDATNAITIDRARGQVVYEHVHFNYATRTDTLTDITFEAKPGQVTAIVGPTGAGKSTLVSLLPRFYDVKGGRVLIDGHDIRSLSLESLRRQFSIVLQEPLLFSGTIADNIRYGRLDATDAEIIEATKSANAHDFIQQLPQQYETMLGERGAAISGGERQRISVARAFLKNAPILILDEPTSSIDSKTEAVILDALDRLMAGRTTFLIAHRLSTVRNADLILVLNHGRIVEQGRQEQLLQHNGLYKQLYDTQTALARRKSQPAPA